MPTKTKKDRSQEIRAYQIANAAGRFVGEPVVQKKLDAITLGEIVKRDVGNAYRIVEVEARDGKILDTHTVEGGDAMTLEECMAAFRRYQHAKADKNSQKDVFEAFEGIKDELSNSATWAKNRFECAVTLKFSILATDRAQAEEIAENIKKAGGFVHEDADVGLGMIVIEHPTQADLLTIEKEVYTPET